MSRAEMIGGSRVEHSASDPAERKPTGILRELVAVVLYLVAAAGAGGR